jgi:1-phosphofructokinase family hexose kinase
VTAVISPNVAVDVYYVVDALVGDAINRASASWPSAGGKGINCARALRALGGRPRCVGIAGGWQAGFVGDELRREGIDSVLVESGVPSRIVASVVETESGRSTVFTSRGARVDAAVAAAYLDEAVAAGTGAWACLLTGSVPPGMRPNAYGQITTALLDRGTRTCVDADGELLRSAVEAGAWIVKVNREEFGRTFPDTAPEALMRDAPLLDMVVITDGGAGAEVHERGRGPFVVRTPIARIVSALGAGDTFAAALLHALEQGAPVEAAARRASAAAAASTLSVGCGTLDPIDVRRLERATTVRQLVTEAR